MKRTHLLILAVLAPMLATVCAAQVDAPANPSTNNAQSSPPAAQASPDSSTTQSSQPQAQSPAGTQSTAAAGQASTPAGPIPVSSAVAGGNLIKKVPPHYPEGAKAARLEGTVRFDVVIDKQGNVTHIRVVEGDPLLVGAALDAVQDWKYKPYISQGEPVEVATTITVIFTLGEVPGTKSSPAAGTPEALGGKAPKDGQIVPGTLVTKIQPEYPASAKAQGLSGSVTLRIVIDKKGNVLDARAVGGDPVFFESAAKAVRQWKYTPSKLKGKPINVVTQITLTYKTPAANPGPGQPADSH